MYPRPVRVRRRAALAVLLVTALLFGLAACTGTPDGGTPAAGREQIGNGALTSVRAPSTRAGGTLRVVADSPDSLDPARSYFPWVWNLMRLYNRTLVTYAAKPGSAGAELVPDLAQDLGTVSEDLRTWTFTLKEGVLFDDGTPITSMDVKYAIERSFATDVIVGGPTYVVDLLDDASDPYPGPYEDASLDKLALPSIDTPDPRTIVFTLVAPYADFRHVLALPSSAPVPIARDTKQAYGDRPASSGPYMITQVDPIMGLVLERNPHWNQATDPVRTALPDRIEVRTGMSALDRDQAVLSGAADVDLTATGVHPQTEARILASPALAERADDPATGAIRMLALPATVPPFDNPQCRVAVSLAVDREAVAAALGGELHAQPTGQLWPSVIGGGSPAEAPSASTSAAEEALAACGQSDGLTVNLAAPNTPAGLQVAEAVAAAMAKIGITAKITGLDPATYYTEGIGKPDTVTGSAYGLVSVQWNGDYPAPSSFLPMLADSRLVQPSGNANYAVLRSPDIDALIDAAMAAPDPAESTVRWKAVEQAVTESAGYVPLVEERVLLIAGERLRNVVVSAAYAGYDLAVAGVL